MLPKTLGDVRTQSSQSQQTKKYKQQSMDILDDQSKARGITPRNSGPRITLPPLSHSNDIPLTTSEEENVTFLDQEHHNILSQENYVSSPNISDASVSAELADFLKRPVNIGNFTWNESDTVGTITSFSPWQLYFANTSISNKLKNYGFIRCTLNIKILLNASPFYYGSMIMAYQPLPNFKSNYIATGPSNQQLIPYSQQPHIWLYPQQNEGGELQLPFLYPKNFIGTFNNQEFLDMGILRFINYTALQSANGVTGTGVTISIYAYASDVVISGPTTVLYQQSEDEYDSKPSLIASSLSKASNALRRVPIIGPFARSSELGFALASKGLAAMGFTNVPVARNTHPYQPTPYPQLASTELSYPLDKLTIDPKQELTVDNSAVGFDTEDNLNIKNLVTRESYLTTATWNSTSAVDTILFSSAISPMLSATSAGAGFLYYHTPMAWVGTMFQYWRGDIIFRFTFIATQYHRGRVRITYDPLGSTTTTIYNTAATQPTNYTAIIDLSKDTNVEFRIPYMQALPLLKCGIPGSGASLWSTSSSPSNPFVLGNHNGLLTIRVVTALTAPIGTSNVPILVSVRGADNLHFSAPIDIPNFSIYSQQSLSVYDTSDTIQHLAGKVGDDDDSKTFLINAGEQIVSLRQVLRRYSVAYCDKQAISGDICIFKQVFPRLPVFYGYDPNGLYSAKGITVPASNFNFNFVPVHPLAWVTCAFVGYRGSINWSCNVSAASSSVGSTPITQLTLSRLPWNNFAGTAPSSSTTSSSIVSGTASANANFLVNEYQLGNSTGLALTNQETNAGLNVSNPNYTWVKFMSTNTSGDSVYDDSAYGKLALRGTAYASTGGATWLTTFKYAAAGTDFSVQFFLNVPTMYIYSSSVTPN